MKLYKRIPIENPFFWAIFYFIGLGILSIILGQDVSWDLRNYHFYNPYMLLTGRFKYDILPAQIQTFFNPLLDVPFFVAIYYLKLPPIAVGFLLGGFHGLNQLFVHLLTYRSLGKLSENVKINLSVLAAITSVFGAAYLSELGTSIGDNTTSVFILAGLFLIVDRLSREGRIPERTVMLAGLLLGLGAGFKLTNALYSISLLVAMMFLPNSWKDKFRNLILVIPAMAIGVSVTAGYWIFLMWTQFASPLFPFYNKFFKSPYIETDYSFSGIKYLPKDLWQWLFYPLYFVRRQTLVSEVPFQDSRLAIAYLLSVIVIGVMLYRYITKRPTDNDLVRVPVLQFLLPFSVTAYLLWMAQFGIYRYLMVVELLTPVLILLCVAYLYPRRQPALIVTVALFALILVTVKPMDWWRSGWSLNYFDIDRQALQGYENSTIILWGDEPTSYIVPHFPASARFVRLKGNTGVSEGTLMRKNARTFIGNTPENSLYILQTDFNKKAPDIHEDLAKENLAIDLANCRPFPTKIDKFNICSLKKTQ
ncbi:hypothetical protein [Pannus brasiliensis]